MRTLFTLAAATLAPLTLTSRSAEARTIDSPVTISGTTGPDPSSSCVYESEATPEAPFSLFSLSVKLFAPFSPQSVNYSTSSWNNWQGTKQSLPLSTSLSASAGDPSATSHGGYYYASTIGIDSSNHRCIAIAATTDTLLATGSWQYPLACFSPADTSTDGPVLDYFQGGASLWATERDGTNIKLTIAPNCSYGQPGGTACPANTPVTMPYSDISAGQATVSVNPCTGHGVVAYWDSSNRLRLNIRTSSGTQVKDWIVASNLSHLGNYNCGNGQVRLCAGCECAGDGCSPPTGVACGRTLIKPQVVVGVESNACYAYVTTDTSLVASDGHRYYKSLLYIVDLGTSAAPKETTPSIKKAWQSTSSSYTWNQWQPTLSISYSNPYVGWFAYSDVHGACNTVFEGWTDTASAFTNLSATGAISNQFPDLRYSDTAGLGDYVMGVRRPADGKLYASWSQTIPTSDSQNGGCPFCVAQGRYSKVVRMTRVSLP